MGLFSPVQCSLPPRSGVRGQEEGMGPTAMPFPLLSWLSSRETQVI